MRGIDLALDGAQGMIDRRAVVEVQDGQKLRLGLWSAAHAVLDAALSIVFKVQWDFFNTLLEIVKRYSKFTMIKPPRIQSLTLFDHYNQSINPIKESL